MEERIQIAHGGGGRLSSELVNSEILPRFGRGPLKDLPDAAALPNPKSNGLIFSTDSFVIQPVEFPGGNIGNLCIYGTVNDISVAGGKPLFISLGLILEEGLEFTLLGRILDSIKKSADECRVKIVTGDTKVVPKGQCDRIYINTSGIGRAYPGYRLCKGNIRVGDRIIASGNLGDHGTAILCFRESVGIRNGPSSDLASVQRLVETAQRYGRDVRFMRDPTRGGAAAVLNEIVSGRKFGIMLDEKMLPYSKGARAVSEMLGLDLLHSPCEGRVLMVCSENCAGRIVSAWRRLPEGRDACVIGTVTGNPGKVTMRTESGGMRMIDLPRGELLPRIC